MDSIHKMSRAARYIGAEVALRGGGRPATKTALNVVVSLTTFPARISSVWKTLETLYRQSMAPSKIVLVLSADEFPQNNLPTSVTRYCAQGLEIRFVEGNIRSYKKLIPALEEFPDKVLVTADDDVLYPRHWLEDLVNAQDGKPNHILGHRGTEIVVHGQAAAPYVTWPQGGLRTAPDRMFLTGLGGILYPPGSLAHQVYDLDLASRLCPTADDIWFKAMALLRNTPVAKVSDKTGDFITVREAQSASLRHVNVFQDGNDRQFKAVMDHFSLWHKLL